MLGHLVNGIKIMINNVLNLVSEYIHTYIDNLLFDNLSIDVQHFG